jgi:hypothetical protein
MKAMMWLAADGYYQVSGKIKMNKYFFIGCIFCFVLLSCKKQDDTIDTGLEYYPIDTGKYYIYQVQLTTFNSNSGTVDTTITNYQLKEYYHGTISSSDELLYRIERYTRTSDTAQWPAQPDSGVWTVASNNNMIIRTENNQPFVKMEFPVQANNQWNGNLFNTLGQVNYVMYPVNNPYTLGDTTYPYTLTVTQSNEQSLIDKDYQIEVYAKGTGLIYKHDEVVEYDQSNIGEYLISSGTIYDKKLFSYGP